MEASVKATRFRLPPDEREEELLRQLSAVRQAKLLRQLRDAASHAIEVIDKELSGIRDGDGRWHGSDVVRGITNDLIGLCQQILSLPRGKREIVLDIKTTGANPLDGDRLIEIGCIEFVNRIPSGNTFHAYFNPERGVPAEAFAAHGLSVRRQLRL